MDPFNLDDWATVGTVGEPPACDVCYEENDEIVDLRAEEKWLPGRVVDVWRCPQCDHEVIRGDADNERWV